MKRFDDLPDGFYLLKSKGEPYESLVKLYNHPDFKGVRHVAFGAWDGAAIMPVWDIRDDSTLTPVLISSSTSAETLTSLQDQLAAAQGALLREGITVGRLQAQLAERDKTILEQQARIAQAAEILLWDDTRLGNDAYALLTANGNPSVLEAALKAERIKTLEDAADIAKSIHVGWVTADVSDELRRMANELKEQS